MAGTILHQNQIDVINAAWEPLTRHVAALLASDPTPYGRMRIHALIETLDSAELYAIFRPISFLSPAEKKSFVRAAVYEILLNHRDGVLPETDPCLPKPEEPIADVPKGPVTLDNAYQPAFKLNAATVASLKETTPPAQ